MREPYHNFHIVNIRGEQRKISEVSKKWLKGNFWAYVNLHCCISATEKVRWSGIFDRLRRLTDTSNIARNKKAFQRHNVWEVVVRGVGFVNSGMLATRMMVWDVLGHRVSSKSLSNLLASKERLWYRTLKWCWIGGEGQVRKYVFINFTLQILFFGTSITLLFFRQLTRSPTFSRVSRIMGELFVKHYPRKFSPFYFDILDFYLFIYFSKIHNLVFVKEAWEITLKSVLRLI